VITIRPPKTKKHDYCVSVSTGMCFPVVSGKRGFGSFVPSHRPAPLGTRFRANGLGQSGAYTACFIVDIVAIDVEFAVIVDIGGIITIVAGRAEPPPESRTTKTPDNAIAHSRLKATIAFCRCLSKRPKGADSPS